MKAKMSAIYPQSLFHKVTARPLLLQEQRVGISSGYRTRPLRYWTGGTAQCHLRVIERPEPKARAVTKIDRIDAIIIDVPTVRGHVLSMTTMLTQSVVLVRIRFSDGSEGLGEGASIGGLSYGPESVESVKLAIDTYIAPALVGMDGDAIAAASAHMEKAVKGNPIARAAVECALWDGLGRRAGLSVAQLFGGRVHDRLPVAWTLASGNSQTDIEEALLMLDARRHRDFKLKIGKRSVKQDIAHVAAIAAAVGDRGTIRVDVNQAWSLTDARYGARGLQEIGCVLIEQPVARDKLAALKALTDGYEIAIMADEVLQGPADAMRVAANRSADVFAVKVCQSGGLKPASDVIAIARAAGIDLYGGTMLESGLGTAAAIQLFATVPDWQFGTELFGPLLLKDEILSEPLEYKDFSVTVPQGPGFGVSLDDDKVNFYRRDRTVTAKVIAGE
jgi:muconate cycloisomerase